MMTENIKKMDAEDEIGQCKDDITKPKKHKHNSKRRKPKKVSPPDKETSSDFDKVIKKTVKDKTLKNIHFKSTTVTNLENLNEKKEKKTNNENITPKNVVNNKDLIHSNCLKYENTTPESHKNLHLMNLLPELNMTIHSNNSDYRRLKHLKVYSTMMEILSSEKKCYSDSTEIKAVSERNKLSNNFTPGKSKKVKKTKIEKKIISEYIQDSLKTFDDSQRLLLNYELNASNNNTEEQVSSTSKSSTGTKKRQQTCKNSKTDSEFPKHLTSEELNLMKSYGVLTTGIIRINQKNYKEAFITAPDKGMDILIDGLRDRNRALEGDEVYVILKPKEHLRTNSNSTDFQRTAVVVGLKTLNHNRGAIGTLSPVKSKNDNFAMFSPRDTRLPRIKIRKNHWPKGFAEDPQSFKDKLLFVNILHWTQLRFAEGEVVKEVGLVGDIEAETSAILLSHGLDTSPYSESLKRCISPSMFTMTEEDLMGREDFRADCVFTIDPATAVDLDDAVSCKLLPNGNYQVGVHISDVTHYLKEGTPLDSAISKRATTVYLVQKAYHMLPYELCRLCSLTPGEDKLSFSVIWEVSPECEVLSHRFAKTIINSCGQFSYDQVQSILDGSLNVEFPKLYTHQDVDSIKKIILFLHKMAVALRRKRYANGALRIDQRKIKFILNDMQLPVEFRVEAQEESHRLIEELMLLANITVAEELIRNFPEIAFLRSHSPPIGYMLRKLQKHLEKYNIHLDISSAGSINNSLIKYSGNETKTLAQALVLNNLLAKPMMRANYYCSGLHPHEEDRHHYALNVSLYTHFTSPIRRYADIMVHRLLGSLVSQSRPPRWTVDNVESIANNCNKQKYAAKMAGEASTELYLAVYIGLNGSMISEAVVCDIKDRSFDCIILDTGAHQRVYYEQIKAELKQTNDDGISCLRIKWPIDSSHSEETIQTLKMFSLVKVELKRGAALKVEASLLRE